MAISVHVVDQNGVQQLGHDERKLEVFQGDSVNLERMLNDCRADVSFHYLPFIDFYGDTYFNILQLEPFLAEWSRLRPVNDVERDFLSTVEMLADAVKSDVHLYLKFLGD
jgi:hypothetical protein